AAPADAAGRVSPGPGRPRRRLGRCRRLRRQAGSSCNSFEFPPNSCDSLSTSLAAASPWGRRHVDAPRRSRALRQGPCVADDPLGIGQDHFRDLAGQHRADLRSEEHTSELQSRENLVCRLLLEKKKENKYTTSNATAT